MVVGYIYCNIAYLIPISISYEIDILCIIFSSIIVAYLFAIILQKNFINKLLDFFKIRNTGNTYYWDDLMDNVYPMKVSVLLCDKTYEGMIHSYESESNSPHIILAAYLIKDLMGNIVENHSNDDTKVIILDTNSIKKWKLNIIKIVT